MKIFKPKIVNEYVIELIMKHKIKEVAKLIRILYDDRMADKKWNIADKIYVCCEIGEILLSCKVASLEYQWTCLQEVMKSLQD